MLAVYNEEGWFIGGLDYENITNGALLCLDGVYPIDGAPTHLVAASVYGNSAIPLKDLAPVSESPSSENECCFVLGEGLYTDYVISSSENEIKDGAVVTVAMQNSSSETATFYPRVKGDIIAHAKCNLAGQPTMVWVVNPN